MNGGPHNTTSPAEAVTKALQDWRQGDCVVGPETFIHRFQAGAPLTDAAQGVDNGEAEYTESGVLGLVVVSQSCDIVRDARSRPYIEVSPLVEVSEAHLGEVKKCLRPNYVWVPGLHESRLVGDLDRTMTVEKSVVARWAKVTGCRTDGERSRFAWALARKRARFAFPNDFNEWVSPLQKRITGRHDKNSAEGRALREITEIWVRAEPDWNANPVELTFFFIRSGDEATIEGKRWDDWREEWLALIPEEGRFRRSGVIGTLDVFQARDLRESAYLDLDYLSERE